MHESDSTIFMKHINIEIKAKCFHPEMVEAFLFEQKAEFAGVDIQKDTYFNIHKGRLKLRQGNIENNLIFYNRNNQKGPKQSDFHLAPVTKPAELESLLCEALDIKGVVEKKRKIFFLHNIKVHLDEVTNLGSFLEIEVSNILNPETPVEILYQQCTELMQQLNIKEEDLLDSSYSDMLFK
jgi:adenylate cyclase class 2